MACPTCQDFGGDIVLQGISIAALDLTATAGCSYCTLIEQCLHGMFHVEDILGLAINPTSQYFGLAPLLAVFLRKGYRPRNSRVGFFNRLNIEVILVSLLLKVCPIFRSERDQRDFMTTMQTTKKLNQRLGQEAPGDWVQMLRPVPEDPMSIESLAFVSDCLERCLTRHSQNGCGALDSRPVFPSRVIDLTKIKIGLIKITPYQKELGPYLALSHRWGEAVSFKPTLSSTALFDNIDLQILPNTFRDAIELTIRLEYSYIWIDSLCI